MRMLGVWLVGFGIVILISCLFPIANAETLTQLLGWLACTGLVPCSMILIGINLVRRAEDRQLVRRAEDHQSELPVSPPPPPEKLTLETYRTRFRNFDLNQLNWRGWLLFFATLGLIGIAIVIVVQVHGTERKIEPRMMRVIAAIILLAAVGFFVGMKWLLKRCGFPITRQRNRGESLPDHSATESGQDEST
ncbi:MAG: hypothetical protein N2112_04340 [Gemmataceae bacterium]|jgi:hypothetical protein|nr:hypothetical protein [Gemmataceae bacterium]